MVVVIWWRSDLIEVFKITHGLEGLNSEDFFEYRQGPTRGHEFKFFKHRSRLNVRKYFLTQRVVEEWNKLPVEVVSATTVNSFKAKLEPLLRQIGGTL